MPFFQVGGKSLFYTHVRPKLEQKGLPTFVFIHGLGSSHAFYTAVIESLSCKGYPCISFDTHGSGLSPLVPNQEPASIKSIAKDVEDIAQQLSIKPEELIVVGHSMGGIVVSELAIRLKLKGAVLIGPVLPKPALGQIFNARIETVKQKGMEAMADIIPGAATGSKSTPTHKAFIRALLLSQRPEGYNSLCRAIADAERPNYSGAHCPVLIVAGEDDKTSPLADAQVILDEWGCEPQLKSIKILSGIGHWHCIEAAEDVGSQILKFASK